MGRKDKSYRITLHKQAYNRLQSLCRFGRSKKEDQLKGEMDYIYSFNTFKNYWAISKRFLNYVKDSHEECTTLKESRKYIADWLTLRETQTDSAWTVQTEAKALGKLFKIHEGDEDYYVPPKRERSKIVRSRGKASRDVHFSELNNYEFVCFCKGTGLRRHEIASIRNDCLYTKEMIEEELQSDEEMESWHKQALLDTKVFDETFFIRVVGKGGRERYSPIIGPDSNSIVERITSTPANNRVWEYVPGNSDIHSYRSVYATSIYKEYARNIEDIPKDKHHDGIDVDYSSEIYFCRKDESGKKLDKRAMFIASKALGHNRIQVVADNYIRGL